jgi:hypothetical protein
MRFDPLKLKEYAMSDGYAKVDGYTGPFRLDGKVVYFDNTKNKYIPANNVYMYIKNKL